MSDYTLAVAEFYRTNLPGGVLEKSLYQADCPFCSAKGLDGSRRLVVTINRDGFFHGYFRCLNRCVPGGFPLWFAALAKIDPEAVPGHDPDRESLLRQTDYPAQSINQEVKAFQDNLGTSLLERFHQAGVSAAVLKELGIGYNGRYLVYPYVQEDGNCYTARCVYPDRPTDWFWYGDEALRAEPFQIFNVEDIQRCENGTLVICEGEDNLLTLKQMGLPGVAVPDSQVFDSIDAQRFAFIRTLFIVTANNGEAEMRARSLASRVGHKVRLLRWPMGMSRDYNLWQLAQDKGADFSAEVIAMARSSRAFSPFATPKREHERFFSRMQLQSGDDYTGLKTGLARLDEAVDGIHGINVIGGAPKVGKSCFMIQIATEMARRGVPVIYYDFENGRQKILQRTLVRLSRIAAKDLQSGRFDDAVNSRYQEACREFKRLLTWFRIVNDRQLTPEIMRRHIDFMRHETQRDFTVVVIDSLHKLPFRDLSERRSGIDAWLRQLESIRDQLQVSFLVISELSRGEQGSYRETPHLGVFKGSGDIEYSADNAFVLYPDWDQQSAMDGDRLNHLWLVASREHSSGLVAGYRLDYPYWGFTEVPVDGVPVVRARDR